MTNLPANLRTWLSANYDFEATSLIDARLRDAAGYADMDFATLKAASAREIALAFGVPPQRAASAAGCQASSIVFMPGSALPRWWC